MVEKKSGRGGARPGSGRKASGKTHEKFSVFCTSEERAQINEMAGKEGKKISRFVLDKIFGRD